MDRVSRLVLLVVVAVVGVPRPGQWYMEPPESTVWVKHHWLPLSYSRVRSTPTCTTIRSGELRALVPGVTRGRRFHYDWVDCDRVTEKQVVETRRVALWTR